MAKSSTTYKPGQSGNPNGRPPKERELAALLLKAGSKSVEVDGKRVSGKQFVSQAVWELVTTGKTRVGDRELLLGSEGWFEIVKWIHTHIDGPAKSELDVNQGGTLTIKIEYADPDPA